MAWWASCGLCAGSADNELRFQGDHVSQLTVLPNSVLLGRTKPRAAAVAATKAAATIATAAAKVAAAKAAEPGAGGDADKVMPMAPTVSDASTPSTRDCPEGGRSDRGCAPSEPPNSNDDSNDELGDSEVECPCPDVRAQLSSVDLAWVAALETELGAEDIEAVRRLLVPGEALESCLLRFLRPKGGKAKAAAKALRAHIAWHVSVRPAELAEMTPWEAAGCDEALIRTYLPTWHQGIDRLGRPIVITCYGKFRVKPLLDAGLTADRIIRAQIRNSEITARLCGEQSSRLGRDVHNALVIIDAEDLDPQVCCSKIAFELARGFANLDQEHYPDRMGQLFLINAPPTVHRFYRACSWIFPERERQRVQIFGERKLWEPALLELVDADQLPPQCGGTQATAHASAEPGSSSN